VRGTDFVMSLLAGKSDATVHVFEGTVDVADKAANLASGKSTAVEAGNFVSAGQGGVTAPQPFDPAQFLEEIGYEKPAAAPATAPTPQIPEVKPSAAPAAEPSPKPSAEPTPEPSPEPKETPKEPPKEESSKDEAKKKDEPEEPGRSIRILSFQFGIIGLT